MAKDKQTEIPGTERPTIKEIEDAANELHEVVADRLALQESEEKLATRLQHVLHENEGKLVDRDKDGNPGYVYYDGDQPMIAVLKRTEEKVSVRKYVQPKTKAPKKEKGTDA